MERAAASTDGTASIIRMLELPGLGPSQEKHGKDFSDWAELEGNTKNNLEKIFSGQLKPKEILSFSVGIDLLQSAR